MWHLNFGSYQARLEGASKRAGKTLGVPRPRLFPDIERYWQAFSQLNMSRLSGFNGAQALQVEQICAWLDIHSVVDNSERARYYDFITQLDVAFLAWHREQKQEHGKD